MMNMANYIVKYKYKVYDCVSVEPVFCFNGDFAETANKKIKYLDVYYLDNGKMCVMCDLVDEFTIIVRKAHSFSCGMDSTFIL